MDSDAGDEYVRALVLATGPFRRHGDSLTGAGVVVFVKRFDPISPRDAAGRQFWFEEHGFYGDLVVSFEVVGDDPVIGERSAVELGVQLSGQLSQSALMTYRFDFPVLSRENGALFVENGWARARPDLAAGISEPFRTVSSPAGRAWSRHA